MAMVFPKLKKPQLDSHILNNCIPVPNLLFLSIVVERVVAAQLTEYLNDHSLTKPLQSAYRQYHSTETALTFVMNDFLMSLNQKRAVLLVLVDMSVAFDNVNQKLLTGRIAFRLGISGVVLDWVTSYLSDRAQFVAIGEFKSDTQKRLRGVPQESVLGPIFFTIYTQPLGDIVRCRNMKYHLYAGDTQLYITFD